MVSGVPRKFAIDPLPLDFGRDKPYYVYIYRDPRPGKRKVPIYVGKGTAKNGRADLHWRTRNSPTNPIFKAILEKIRKARLEPIAEIVGWFDTHDAAYDLERVLIARYGRRDIKTGALANLNDGGRRAYTTSPVTKAKLSAANKGRRMPPGHNAAAIAVLKGRPLPIEQREKMSAAQKRRWATQTPEQAAKLLANLKPGQIPTPEGIARREAKKAGYRHAPEALAKMSACHKGKTLSSDHRAKMSAAHLEWRKERHADWLASFL